MNKKIIIFGLSVFIALVAMSYVSAGQAIETDMENYDSNYYINGDIPVTNTENKVLKEGKAITKKIEINKEVKTHGKIKTKKIFSREGFKKPVLKKQVKKAVKGKSVFYDLNEILKGAKISKITFKHYKFKDHGYKYIGSKLTIKYKPVVYKTVTKTTKATITADEDGYATIKYTNPFNHKKETEYGSVRYW